MDFVSCTCGKRYKAPTCAACKAILLCPAPDSSPHTQELETRIRVLEQAEAEARETLRRKEVAICETQARIAEMEQVAERESTAAIAKLRAEHAKELEASFAKTAERDAKIRALEDDAAKLRGQGEAIQGLEAEIAGRDERIRSLEGTIRVLREHEQDRDRLQATVDERGEQVRNLEQDRDRLKATVDEQTEQVRNLEQDRDRLKATVDEQTEQRMLALEKSVGEWHDRCDALEAKLKACEETARCEIEQAMRDRDTAVREKEDAFIPLRKEAEDLRSRVKELEAAAETLRHEALNARKHQALAEEHRNEEVRRIVGQTRSLVANLEGELTGVSASLARMHDQCRRTLDAVAIPSEPAVEEGPRRETTAKPVLPIPTEPEPAHEDRERADKSSE